MEIQKNKLFFIGKGKLNIIKTEHNINDEEFIKYYNEKSKKKLFDINISKYMTFDYNLMNLFIEKWPQIKKLFEDLYNSWTSTNEKKNYLVHNFEGLFLNYIPEDKKNLFKEMLKKFK